MSDAQLVMVIDDDQDLRDAICSVLSDTGYLTVAFGDPLDGLDYLASEAPRPSLILLDLMMPGMNGWEFREAQRANPAASSIPVVVMTARRGVTNDTLGVAAIILKPFKLKYLLEVVDAHLRAGRASQLGA